MAEMPSKLKAAEPTMVDGPSSPARVDGGTQHHTQHSEARAARSAFERASMVTAPTCASRGASLPSPLCCAVSSAAPTSHTTGWHDRLHDRLHGRLHGTAPHRSPPRGRRRARASAPA